MTWHYDWTICADCGRVRRLHRRDDGEHLCVSCVLPWLPRLIHWGGWYGWRHGSLWIRNRPVLEW